MSTPIVSGSTPDPPNRLRWLDVPCTCIGPQWAHADYCKRGQVIRECADEDYRRAGAMRRGEASDA
jgi:hypothetical protein